MSTYRLADVRDTAALCESVTFVGRDHRRGEWPYAACVARDPMRVPASAVIRGRSCELGLAIAALADYEGLELAANVIATGCLNDGSGQPVVAEDGSHAVLPVQQLGAKVAAATRHAERAGGRWIVLVPEDCQDTLVEGKMDSAGPERTLPAGGARQEPEARVQVLTVASLLVAARHACKLATGSLAASTLWALRDGLERLRQGRGGLEPILEACRRLHAATDDTHASGGIALVYRYQALIHAAHAVTELGLAGRGPRWRTAEAPAPPRELAARLRAEALALARTHNGGEGRSDVPADFRAASLHYDACRAHVDTDFEWGLERLDQALRVEGLSRDGHSEYRRILGTRAQFRWRHGLRLSALGWESAAERHIRRSLDDIEAAVELTPDMRHPGELARARCYRATANIALWSLQPAELESAELVAQIDADLAEVLGEQLLGDGSKASELDQYPGWGLALLYAWWGLNDRWDDVVAHWHAHRAHSGLGWPGAPAGVGDRRLTQLILEDGPQLYCDLEVASLLAEAAIRCDQPTLLRDAGRAQPPGRDQLRLRDLLMWAPVAAAESAVDLAVSRSIRAWVSGRVELHVPEVARRGQRLDSRPRELLAQLRLAVGAGDLARQSPPRDALLRWSGRLPRSGRSVVAGG